MPIVIALNNHPPSKDTVIDVFLSAFHFLLVLTLVAILAAQSSLIRPGITASNLRLVTLLDRAYGASAVLLLGVGFSRVLWSAKGAPFYLSNPLFWAKIGLFMTVAMFSIPPTIHLIRWSKHAHSLTDFRPPDEQIRYIQRWLYAEWMVVLFIPFLAAAMAHGIGLS
jgi:putative membrane protein